jgi:hypothetical protein
MQTAEKLTPIFVLKLVILFALLSVGVFYKTSKVSQASEANNYIYPVSTETEQSKENQREYILINQSSSNDSSI